MLEFEAIQELKPNKEIIEIIKSYKIKKKFDIYKQLFYNDVWN